MERRTSTVRIRNAALSAMQSRWTGDVRCRPGYLLLVWAWSCQSRWWVASVFRTVIFLKLPIGYLNNMVCWHCGKIILCSCSNCNKKLESPDAFVERVDGNIIFCGYCGFGLNVNAWTDLEIENCEREQIGAFKGRSYDYDIYVELFRKLKIPLHFPIKRPVNTAP